MTERVTSTEDNWVLDCIQQSFESFPVYEQQNPLPVEIINDGNTYEIPQVFQSVIDKILNRE